MTITDHGPRRPLEHVTVLDMTIALAGPFATMLLAGLGARVIRVENPAGERRAAPPFFGPNGPKMVLEGPDDLSMADLTRHRNKLGITLNLKQDGAGDVLHDLIAHSDVVVDNFSRGTLDKLGFDFSFMLHANSRIVWASLTGFGIEGEPGTGGAADTIAQALSGIMVTGGEESDPPIRLGAPLGDTITPLCLIIGILSALEHVRFTGVGERVDASMVGALTALVAIEPFDLLKSMGVPYRTGTTMARLGTFGLYQCSDGYIAVTAGGRQADALFQAMGKPRLGEDPRFRGPARAQNYRELTAEIEAWTRTLTVAECLARLESAGVPSSAVRTPGEAIVDPLAVRRGDTVPLLHPTLGAHPDIPVTGVPVHFGNATVGFDRPAPGPGQHNDEVYGGLLGYASERIAQLRASGVI
ncbi:MAG: CoA transferase [Chloroflexi bacterium]|nr:CoA transferase [Chloroflexota bacterium]